MVEHRTENSGVDGSIPSKHTNNIERYSSGYRNYPDKVGRNATWVQIPLSQQPGSREFNPHQAHI